MFVISSQAKYADTREWFSSILATPEQRMKHATMLQELLNKCLPEGQQVRHTTTIPDSFSRKHGVDEVLLHLPLRLWQLGAHESSRVKGAPPLRGARDNLQRFLRGLGCETSKYPIEILFDWPNQWASLPVPQSAGFSVAISVGSSVTMACHLLRWAAVRLQWLEGDLPDYVKSDLAVRLAKCLCCLFPS